MRYYKSETVRLIYESKRLITGLTDVKISIWGPDKSKLVDQETLIELGDGIYYYDYTPSETGNFIYKCDSNSQSRVLISSFIVEDKIDSIYKLEKNRYKIENNIFTVYDDDGTTALFQFDLKDADGNPSQTNVLERVPK